MKNASTLLKRALLDSPDERLVNQEDFKEMLGVLDSVCKWQMGYYKHCYRLSGLSEEQIEAETPELQAIVTAPREFGDTMSIEVHRTVEGYVATFPSTYIVLVSVLSRILGKSWRDLDVPDFSRATLFRCGVHFGKLVMQPELPAVGAAGDATNKAYWSSGGNSVELFMKRVDPDVAIKALGHIDNHAEAVGKELETYAVYEKIQLYVLVFALLHEFGHIQLEHFETRNEILDYESTEAKEDSLVGTKRAMHSAILSQVDSDDTEAVDAFQKKWSRIKELEADRFAVQQMYYQMDGDSPSGTPRTIRTFKYYLGTLISFALIHAGESLEAGSDFSLMESSTSGNDEGYPHTPIRRALLVEQFADDEWGLTSDEQTRIANQFIEQVDLAARLLDWEALYCMSGVLHSEMCVSAMEVERYRQLLVGMEKMGDAMLKEESSDVDIR